MFSFLSLTFLGRANASFCVQWTASLDTKPHSPFNYLFPPPFCCCHFDREKQTHCRVVIYEHLKWQQWWFFPTWQSDGSIIHWALILNTSTVQTMAQDSRVCFAISYLCMTVLWCLLSRGCDVQAYEWAQRPRALGGWWWVTHFNNVISLREKNSYVSEYAACTWRTESAGREAGWWNTLAATQRECCRFTTALLSSPLRLLFASIHAVPANTDTLVLK